ncbi:protein SCO1/2 [Singulisphaera sp. GP187]|uniref:copper-binding protein n=1 Tax=Singulisphaera sp. GP187 TaxID=1882752 RepID=UPI00092B247E|nr:SCO family protein [Singulisphaera sp. GP187]SIN84161.1 protein SCO1/2 [Singulisphaera sp. GP187]
MNRFLILRLTLVAALGMSAGCTSRTPSSTEPPRATEPVKSPSPTLTHYKLTGVVKRVTPKSGQVVIAHESIPGFMNAMTMPFTLKDHALLDDLQPGDEVEGDLQVEKEGEVVKDYELTGLVVSRPALATPKTLTLSMKNLTIREAPKRLEPGDLVPDFVVTTQDGRPLKLSELRGNIVALTFIYTRCPLPDFCPLMDRKFAELAGKLAASPERSSRVRLLSISFDPEHDTPEVLRKHAEIQGAKPPLWTFAVASHDELAKVAGPLGLTYGPTSTEIIHNLCTAVIDSEGRLARIEVGNAVKNLQVSELLKFIAPLVPAATESTPKS